MRLKAFALRFGSPIALASIVSAVVVNWFSRSNFVLFIDNFFPYNPPAQLWQFSAAWASYNGLGTIDVTNFPLLPTVIFVEFSHSVLLLPLWTSEALMYGVFALVGSIFVFLFIKELSFEDEIAANVAGFTGALFYLLNPVFLDLYWYLNFPGAAGLMAGLPVVGFYVHRAARSVVKGRASYHSLLGISIGTILCSVSEVPYIASAALLILVFVVYFFLPILVGKETRRRSSIMLAGALTCIVGSNAYWLIPELSISSYVSSPNAYNYSQDLATLTGNSANASLWNVISLRYFPISNSFASWHGYYSTSNLPMWIGSIIVLGLIFVPLLAIKPRRSYLLRPGLVIVLSITLLFLTILMMGNNPENPFSSIYVISFSKSLLLQAFLRGPYLSWGPAVAFVTSALFGIGSGCVYLVTRRLLGAAKADSQYKPSAGHSITRAQITAIAIATGIALASVTTVSWPLETGGAVRSLDYPATPVLPQSAYQTASYLQTHQGSGTALVFPTTTGVLSDKWNGGDYLGPPYLGVLSGKPTIQDSSPALGTHGNYLLSLVTTLPSLGSPSDYSKILEMIGINNVVVDGYAQANPFASFTNVSLAERSLLNQSNTQLVESFGNYSVFHVSGSNDPVYPGYNILNQSAAISPAFPLNSNYTSTATNTTDLSGEGYWTSSATISNAESSSFTINEFWPNAYSRQHNGTGYHYPGWPEVTNTGLLDLDVGEFPFLEVNVTLTSGQANPVIGFSSVPVLKVYPNDYDRTIAQFFSASTVESQFENSTRAYTFLYDLASPATAGLLSGGYLEHVLIQLQPATGYSGYINGTVSLTAEAFTPMTSSFTVPGSVIVPDNFSNQHAQQLARLAPFNLSYDERTPSDYIANLRGVRSWGLVILLQNYDPNWTISTTEGFVQDYHFLADGYANGWLFETDSQNLSVSIVFGFVSITYLSQGLSIVVLAFLVIAVVASEIPRMKRGWRNLRSRLSSVSSYRAKSKAK